MRKSLFTGIFIGVFLGFLTVSCGGGGGAPPDSQNPTDVAVTSGITSGQEVSGTVALSGTARDNSGTIQKMEFRVSSPDEVVACTAIGPKPSGSTFSCNWNTTTVANGFHTLKVRAYDPTGNTAESAPINFTVNNPSGPLQITTATLPDGTAGVSYGPFNLQAVGGSPPYTWAIVSGTEPRPDFLSPATGTLSGLISVPGNFPLEFEAKDSQNRTARKSFTLVVQPPPQSFDSSGNPAIAPGEHWFHNFTIHAGETVTITGGNTTLNVTGKLTIEPDGKLIVSDCSELLLNLLSKTQNPEIFGEVSNACTPPENPGGDLIIRTIGNLYVGGSDGQQKGSLSSSGMLFIGDPWYQPRPAPETLEYVLTGEPATIAPVCAIKADTLTSGTPPAFPVNVNFTAIHKDPDGGATTITQIDYGDTTVEQNPATLQHSYASGGVYEVIVTVKDEEGEECQASLMLNLRPPDDPEAPPEVNAQSGPPSVWVGVEPFVADELIKPVGVPFHFTSQRSPVPSSATYETNEWAFSCPSGNEVCSTSQSFTTEGTAHTLLIGEDSSGHQSVASLRVYVPLEGGKKEYSDPPAPAQPFPPLPPSFQPTGFPEPQSHTGTCPDCALCSDPTLSGQPVAVLGNTQLTSWWQGGALVIGYQSATIVVNPTLTFVSTTPTAPVGPGQNGRPGFGWGAATKSGKIVMCGGDFIGAPGQNGGNGGAPGVPNTCNGVIRGGNGGAWFGVLLTAPAGSISFCGTLNVTGASGGRGGDADATGNPVGACTNGCGAIAIAGKGGMGGGGIAYTAPPGQVCYDAGYTVNYLGPAGGMTGGTGGNATAKGSTPPPCPNCNTYAGTGGFARAFAGDGGWSAWYFVTNSGNGPSGPSDPRFVGHITAGGTYNGGTGGTADATAGDGGNSNCVGCNQFAWAGSGGNARAKGGNGGFGLTTTGAGGNASATSGNGGNATATGNAGALGCPGRKGCDISAFGGHSGFATAIPGRPGGASSLTSGVGGNATATAGNGGDGAPCCDGGKGGKALAVGGRDFQGAPVPVDGNATATGGKGGNGGDCSKFEKGGDGGNGGDAQCLAGPFGVFTATGGDGGNGGAGCPQGSGGAGGGAAGVINGNANNGNAGVDGINLCWLWIFQWPYWSWIPEFDGIPPVWTYTLPIYDAPNDDPNQSREIGQVQGKFQNDTEFGAGGPVSYQKTSDGWVYLKPGAIELDLRGTNTYSVTVKSEDLTPDSWGGPGNGANLLEAYVGDTKVDWTANWGGKMRSELTVRSTQPIDRIVFRCHFRCRFWHWWIMLIHDPVVEKPTQAQITVPSTARAGDPIPVEIVTKNSAGQPTHFSFFDVFVEVSGRSGTLADRIPLTDNGDGTYTGNVTLNASGTYHFSPLIHDRSTLEKGHLKSPPATVQVIPTEIVALDLSGSSPFGPILATLRDAYQNPVSNPNPNDVTCTSDNPNLSTGPFQPDPEMPNWRVKADLQATEYTTGNLTCTHLPSGAQGQQSAGYPPWKLTLKDSIAGRTGRGFPPGVPFNAFVEVRVPAGKPGWKKVNGQLVWPKDSGLIFNGCQPTTSQFQVSCLPPRDAPWDNSLWLVDFFTEFLDPGSVIGESAPLFAQFTSPPVSPLVESYIGVPDFHLYDENFNEIVYDPLLFGVEFRHFPVAIKPVRTLNMHIYLVEGSATQEEAQADVDAAEAAFNANALSCNCGFFVDFVPTFTTIPAKDWKKIDTDGDGWDRYDRNGDGDYDDPGDNNDAFEAMNLGYFDSSANTENIYYVPKIRGGALGVTYWPNQQVAVDNSQDNDNLTLFHEKVHELDLRKDGDFDVNDSPHDPNNAQGARDPGNAMNYDNTGPNLTRTQCSELDP